MLKFKNVHIYCNHAGTLDFNVIVPELEKYFPSIPIDVRHPFLNRDLEMLKIKPQGKSWEI